MKTLDIVYYAVLAAAGVYATLIGFRVIRGSRASDARYEAWWSRWGKHLRWLGPVLVAGAVFLLVARR